MHRSAVTLWLLIGTMIFMWATFYAAFYFFVPGPGQVFTSVEEMMSDTPGAWSPWKYTWNQHSSLMVLIYFGLCYGVAWVWRKAADLARRAS